MAEGSIPERSEEETLCSLRPAAQPNEAGPTITGYGTSYSYDVMGNVLSLSRYGDISAGTKGPVDNLTMTYDGNRLVSVQDAAQAVTMSGSMDYPDGAAQAAEFTYDSNDPVNKVDPDGKELVIWYKENGHSYSYHYSGGECTSSNSYVQAVVTAYHYNKTNWHKAGYPGKSQTELVVERKEIINVANADIAGDSFSSVYNTIYWSPELGTKNENGTVTSPATDFDHEADHANATIDGTRGSCQNMEELRVINGSEQKMAKANGDINPNQVTRTNHKGSIVVTTGVMSNEID